MAVSLNNAGTSEQALMQQRLRQMHKEQAAPPAPPQADDKPEGVVNLCPFHCPTEELTGIGHCRHLVGFTSNGKTYEPQIKRMRPAREADGKYIRDDAGKIVKEWDGVVCTDGKNPQLVLDTDILVNTGVSSRVYRADPAAMAESEVADPITNREPVDTHAALAAR